MAITLAGLFLLSFTGLRLEAHHCLSCGTSDYSLFAPAEDCCSSSPGQKQGACSFLPVGDASSCCDTPTDEAESESQECCEDEVVYLVNEYDIAKERPHPKTGPIVTACLDLHDTTRVFAPVEAIKNSLQNFTDPPPRISGRDFVIFSHQIIIG